MSDAPKRGHESIWSVMQREELEDRAEKMHRRAQSAEGKLDRTRRFLNSILDYLGNDSKNFHIKQHIEAAARSARNNTGAAHRLGFALFDRLRRENVAAARKESADRLTTLRAALEEATEALERIAQWSDAYPISVFPEPDFKKAAAVLKASGMTLDSIAASNMRHVVTRVGEMAKPALARLEQVLGEKADG